jgi:hypothetical protein
LNAPDSKSDIGVSLSGVRIPPSPPLPIFETSEEIQEFTLNLSKN